MKNYLIESSLNEKINEELGVADSVKNGVTNLLKEMTKNMSSIRKSATSIASNIKQTNVSVKVNFSETYSTEVVFILTFFENEMSYSVYRKTHPIHNPYYNAIINKIFIEVDDIGSINNLLKLKSTIQHEIHHAYQNLKKQKNGVNPKPNTEKYEVAKQYINDENFDVCAAARAFYMWGTNETSAYGNTFYVNLRNAFLYDGFSNSTIQNVLSKEKIGIMRKYIFMLLRKIEKHETIDIDSISSIFNVNKKKLKSVCKMCLDKIDHVIIKIIAKAKIDYEEESEKYSDYGGEITN